MVIVMLDLGWIGVMCLGRVRPEVAVGDRLVVPGVMLVDVLRRERRCEQQVRAGHDESRGAGQGPNHRCIIRGCGASVNEVMVTGRSEAGH